MKNSILSFDTPPNEWIEGIPVGNGSIGAMIFGTAGAEIITLNHDRLWRDNVEKEIHTADILPEMRRLTLEGKALEAEALFKKTTEGVESRINAYQVFCSLKVSVAGVRKYSDYRSELDLEKGIAAISFSSGDTRYSYELFSSSRHEAVILKMSADRNGALCCRFKFDRPMDPECKWTASCDKDMMLFNGEFTEGVSFAAVAKVASSSGGMKGKGSGISVKGSGEIIVRIVMETSVGAKDPMKECLRRIGLASVENYDRIRTDHAKAHGELFHRTELDIAPAGEGKSTEQMYNDVFGRNSIGGAMYEQFFNMGRYLMISASRPGSLPMNLQGIWNDSIAPCWESCFTMDMNQQMQYWLALPCNLSECELPVFDWIIGNKERMLKRSREIFGVAGAYISQYTDLKMTPEISLPHGSFQVLWPGAAAWMAQHFYEYWKYTGDDKFLLETAFPYMKMCADLFKGILAKDSSGKYISCPSSSPENKTKGGAWIVNTPTMDISIVQELTGHLLEIDDKFRLNDPDRMAWKDLLDNMAPYAFDADGTLREWVEDSEMNDPGHRHISHIYGLFPGKLFTHDKTPKLYEGAVKAIQKRRASGFGSCATWSHAWYACCFSRIKDGDKALESIDNIIKSGMIRNFLTTHNDWRDGSLSGRMTKDRLFQIEALLGATAAIAEMFVQSLDEGIMILPALPSKWKSGEVKGLRAYGGFELAIKWTDGKIAELRVTSHVGGLCRLILCREFPNVSLDGCRFPANDNKIEFCTENGGRYSLSRH